MKIEKTAGMLGPEGTKVMEKNKSFRFPKTRMTQFVAKRGQGCYQQDEDGNTFLDFSAGIAVVNTCHCEPSVVKAIKDQAETLIHTGPLNFTDLQVKLAEKLSTYAHGDTPKRVFFTNSGTEAVEGAIKLARYASKRPGIVSFLGGFHGRSFGAMSVSTSKAAQRERYMPLMGGVYQAIYPNCYRCPINHEYPKCELACLNYIEDVLFKNIVSSEEVAAFLVEPIQGEGGYIVPPDEFHGKLKALAEKYNILYIVDEIQTGIGRTGKNFAMEWWGVEPDIICLAKGIASGMPLGAIVAKDKLFTWGPDSHGSTFGGNLISCAAALATLKVIEEEHLLENAIRQGNRIMERLEEIKSKCEIIGDVRGKGLMIGFEIVENRQNKKMNKKIRDKIIVDAFNKGLLVIPCGESTIRICPPLKINETEIDEGMAVLENCIIAVCNE